MADYIMALDAGTTDPIRADCRELTVSGRVPAIFFRWFNL